MEIEIKNRKAEVTFTFNSFKNMPDLSMNELTGVDEYPFLAFSLVEKLLYGGLNNSKKVKFTKDDVSKFLEEYAETGSIFDLLAELVDELQKSSFFKGLQKTQAKTK